MSSFYTASLYPFPSSPDRINSSQPYTDFLVEESPLSLFIHRRPYATFMRTLGHDLDLIKGFLEFLTYCLRFLIDFNSLSQ